MGCGGDDRAASAPARDRHPCAFARFGLEGEFVRETLGAAQSEAEASSGGVAVLEREIDVSDAGAAIAEREPDAFAHAVIQHFDGDLAAAAVLQRVAREL